MKYIIVFGNPFDGMEVYGPFNTPSEADEWAESVERKMADSNWWMMPITPVSPIEETEVKSGG
jgi:hypothetical protein